MYSHFKQEPISERPARDEVSSAARDPLRVGEPRQPYAPPDNYGRSDLDPFGSVDPRSGMGGMIFDPFRGTNRPRIPGNLPPGAVPPGARYDPFGPPNPDDLSGGSAMRIGYVSALFGDVSSLLKQKFFLLIKAEPESSATTAI